MNLKETAGKFLGQHGNSLMLFASLALQIGGTVKLTIDAPKAKVILDAAKEAKLDAGKEGKPTIVEWAKTVGPVMWPGAAMFAAGTVLGVVNYADISHKEKMATIAAGMAETALIDVKKEVKEQLGEKQLKDIEKSVASKKLKTDVEDRDAKANVVLSGFGDYPCYDENFHLYFWSTQEKINKAVNTINFRLQSEMDIAVSELFEEIGIDRRDIPSAAERMYFTVDNGPIELSYDTHEAHNAGIVQDGFPCCLLIYDYITERNRY